MFGAWVSVAMGVWLGLGVDVAVGLGVGVEEGDDVGESDGEGVRLAAVIWGLVGAKDCSGGERQPTNRRVPINKMRVRQFDIK